MSDRKDKKHKKKKHKKEKKPRLHERVGYTDDDNPFGDRDLGATFVWKKKEDQSRKKKRPPPSRDEEDRIEEIEKVLEEEKLAGSAGYHMGSPAGLPIKIDRELWKDNTTDELVRARACRRPRRKKQGEAS